MFLYKFLVLIDIIKSKLLLVQCVLCSASAIFAENFGILYRFVESPFKDCL